jgi:hypothetical protein
MSDMATVASLIKRLQEDYDPNDEIAYDIWSAADFEGDGEGYEFTLTDEDKAGVLHLLHAKHDANEGLTWDSLRTYTERYLDEKENGA